MLEPKIRKNMQERKGTNTESNRICLKEISENVLDKMEAQIVSEIVGESFPLLKNQILWLKEHSDNQEVSMKKDVHLVSTCFVILNSKSKKKTLKAAKRGLDGGLEAAYWHWIA